LHIAMLYLQYETNIQKNEQAITYGQRCYEDTADQQASTSQPH
jgi:hypothetical protein